MTSAESLRRRALILSRPLFVKIVVECREDLLLEAVAMQDAKIRILLFIQYPYLYDTRPEYIAAVQIAARLRIAMAVECFSPIADVTLL